MLSERQRKNLLSKKGVVGVGFGTKIIKGIDTGETCVKVWVIEKKPKKKIKKADLIPERIKGTGFYNRKEIDMKTDVEQSGRIEAQIFMTMFPPLERRQKQRPAKCGCSIGHYKVTAGTLGAVVYRGKNPFWWSFVYRMLPSFRNLLRNIDRREKFILSNNHVLANSNNAMIGDTILQPAAFDSGTPLGDTIGVLYDFIELRKKNFVDCAIARPLRNVVSPEIMEVGFVKGIKLANIGMKVQKFGRTSGYTQGEVKSINTTIKVFYGEEIGELEFEEQIITTEMSGGGDSGSLLLDMNNNATGLLFAGSLWVSVHNEIWNVLNALGGEYGII